MKSKRKSRRINSYTKPKTVKQSVKFPFKRVRIDWIDIITEGGWGSETEFKNKTGLYKRRMTAKLLLVNMQGKLVGLHLLRQRLVLALMS